MSYVRSLVKRNRALRTPLFLLQNAGVALRFLPSQRLSVRAGGPQAHYLSAVVRVKDEARFLPEWLAHHFNLGIEHFYVYDNGSCDGTREAISPFVERGTVTYVYWPMVPVTPSCYVDFFERFGPTSKWVAFFDADEFLFERAPGAALQVLRGSEGRPAVAINWRYFGSAGYEAVPTGLVTERFTRADASGDEHVKVIAQPSEVLRYRNAHNFYYRNGRLAVTPGGQRVYGSFARASNAPLLVLHHYVYRSRQDYERKVQRGFAEERGAKERARQNSRAQAEFHRHNEVGVAIPKETVRATAELLRELGVPADLYVPS
jgi:hypothetical protein